MDAEAVVESGSAPPDEPRQAWATRQEAERGPSEGQTLPGTPRGAISAIEVEKPEITAHQPEVSIRQQGDHDTIGSPAVTERADLAAKTNKQEGERELLQPEESHEGGHGFSRRSFLRGLGAAAAASAAPEDIVEAAAKATEPSPRLLAMESATNVWQLHEPYYVNFGPNDFHDLCAEAIQHLTDLAGQLERDPETFGDKIRAYREAARLLESGWTPPARLLPDPWPRTAKDHGAAPEEPRQASTFQQDAEHAAPDGQTPPFPRGYTIESADIERGHPNARKDLIVGGPPEWHILPDADGNLKIIDGRISPTKPGQGPPPPAKIPSLTEAAMSPRPAHGIREHETIATEIETADKALKDQEHKPDQIFPAQGVPRPDVAPNRLGAVDFEMHRSEIRTAVTILSAETGLPYTPTVDGEFVAGIHRGSLTLSSGRLAVIDNGLGFALVPWTPELDRHLGRHVTGVARESGGIEWNFGRKRGIEI